MPLENLQKVIKKLQDRITNHDDYLRKEFRARILLVDPLLRELGWDVEDPDLVQLESEPTEKKKKLADYILKNNRKNVSIVEIKNINKKIDDFDHKEQAEGYASLAGAQFFILTNGIIWLLYKRDSTTKLELLNPIARFDVKHDETYLCALEALSIWKPNLASGSPKETMKPTPEHPQDKIEEASSVSPVSVSESKRDSSLPPRKQLQLKYWTALKNRLEQRDGVIKSPKPLSFNYMNYGIGGQGYKLVASASKKHIRVILRTTNEHGKILFHLLKAERMTIEKEIDAKCEWKENPVQNDICVYLRNANFENRQDWERQHQWLCEKLETFHKVFLPRIEAFNASN